MKPVFQIIISIVLGSLLGIGVYNKMFVKNTIVGASDIEMDLSLLTDDIDFAQKQKEADSLAYIKYQDSLQRAIILVETESVKPVIKQVSSEPKPVEKKPELVAKPKVSVQPKIELAAFKKPATNAIPITEIQAPEKIEVVSIKKAAPAIEPVAPETNGSAQSQPQPEKKKKFLFFNKKNQSKNSQID